MAKFVYNNAKNIITNHKFFKLNCKYHPYIFFEDELNLYLNSRSGNKLAAKLRNLMIICQQNLLSAQKLQKRTNDKRVKPQSYILDEKGWLNSKYMKTKWNQKLQAKLFKPFWILHPVE